MTIKKDSELGIFSLNEKRNSQIDEALIKNKEKAKKIGEVATPDLRSIIMDQVDKEAYSNIGKSLEDIEDEETREDFIEAYENSIKLFALIGLTPPTPYKFREVGGSIEHFADKYKEMKEQGLKPILIISPVLKLKSDEVINSNGLDEQLSWTGLHEKLTEKIQNFEFRLQDKIVESKDYLFQQELDLVVYNKMCHVTVDANNNTVDEFLYNSSKPISNSQKSGNIAWTVALISGTDEPQDLDVPHHKLSDQDKIDNDQYITISQYITIQFIRIQSNQKLLDQVNFTWLDGELKDSNMAPLGSSKANELLAIGTLWVSGNRLTGIRLLR